MRADVSFQRIAARLAPLVSVALSVLVAVYPAYMVGSILTAASPASTRINLAAAFVPGGMKSAPDESTCYGEGPRETMEI